jgi:hypothetical protein
LHALFIFRNGVIAVASFFSLIANSKSFTKRVNTRAGFRRRLYEVTK